MRAAKEDNAPVVEDVGFSSLSSEITCKIEGIYVLLLYKLRCS